MYRERRSEKIWTEWGRSVLENLDPRAWGIQKHLHQWGWGQFGRFWWSRKGGSPVSDELTPNITSEITLVGVKVFSERVFSKWFLTNIGLWSVSDNKSNMGKLSVLSQRMSRQDRHRQTGLWCTCQCIAPPPPPWGYVGLRWELV